MAEGLNLNGRSGWRQYSILFSNGIELPEAIADFSLGLEIRVSDEFGIKRSAMPIIFAHFWS